LNSTPLPPGRRTTNPISPELEETILKCLEKEAEARPQTAAELRDLLRTSPHVAEWGAEARVAWWLEYHKQAAPKPGETEHAGQVPTDVTVTIDIGSRMNPP
jgi:hypothetical protein